MSRCAGRRARWIVLQVSNDEIRELRGGCLILSHTNQQLPFHLQVVFICPANRHPVLDPESGKEAEAV
jgi:hypothetical protein